MVGKLLLMVLKLMLIKSEEFLLQIEKLCTDKKIEYIDAVVHWCSLNNIEVETVASWIKKDPVMRSKVQAEAENLNILKRGARLPI